MTHAEEAWNRSNGESSVSQRVREEHAVKVHSTVKEYDWLNSSMSGASVGPSSNGDNHIRSNFDGDMELRLGIGPPNTVKSVDEKRTGEGLPQTVGEMKPNSSLYMNMEVATHMASAPELWQTSSSHLHIRQAPTMNYHNQFQFLASRKPEPNNTSDTFGWAPPGLSPGAFMIPMPMVTAIPSKRPCPEPALQDHQVHHLTHQHYASTGNTNSISASASVPVPVLHQATSPATLAFPSISALLKQEADSGKAAYDQSRMANVCPVTAAGVGDPVGNAGEVRIESDRASVVGWPPIRSFRKNTLAAGKESNRHAPPGGGGGGRRRREPGGDHLQMQLGDNNSGLYVKAKLDGVKIGRKVDLKAYDSYDSLKLALQDMFQGYVNGHGEMVKLDLMKGDDYVLTHEDKEGDWMLVGDVPWEMFATTVKSLRIMKSCDGQSLGNRPHKYQQCGRPTSKGRT